MHALDSPLSWDDLVTALREELQEKGGLIRLLNEQTEVLYRRDREENTRLEAQIKNQTEVTVRCRQTCKSILGQTASKMTLPQDASAQEVLARFPVYVQPLLEALFSEVERLSGRLVERHRQNQQLKQRLLESAPPIL